MKNSVRVMGFAALLLFPAFALTVQADEYYEGKTIRIVVSYTAGGTFDITSRIFAKYLSKYIPGKPLIIVQNMPGAGGNVAANYVFNVAKPDGTTIGNIHANRALAQALQEPGVHFDVTRFEWIGSVSSGPSVLTIRSDLPYNKAEELRGLAQPLHFAAEARHTVPYIYPNLLHQFGGLELKPVVGYPGVAESIAAIERGESDGRAGSYMGVLMYVERGIVKPIVRSAFPTDLPGLKGVKLDTDIVNPEVRPVIDALSGPYVVGRGYVVPPGTPAEVVKILRQGFLDASRDPGLIQELRKAALTLGPEGFLQSEEAAKLMRGIVTQPRAIFDQLKRLQQ